MRRMLLATALTFGIFAPTLADAAELQPLQAGTFVLSNQTVSIYYTARGDTYEVVATIAPDPEAAGAPIRFVGFLRPGQKALVSAGEFGVGPPSETLQLVHRGDLLSATRMPRNLAAK